MPLGDAVAPLMYCRRQSELLRLRCRDLDWRAQKVRVRNPWVRSEFSDEGKSDLSTSRSIALVGFGLDSAIEGYASVISHLALHGRPGALRAREGASAEARRRTVLPARAVRCGRVGARAAFWRARQGEHPGLGARGWSLV